jgi:hypothetical protein
LGIGNRSLEDESERESAKYRRLPVIEQPPRRAWMYWVLWASLCVDDEYP